MIRRWHGDRHGRAAWSGSGSTDGGTPGDEPARELGELGGLEGAVPPARDQLEPDTLAAVGALVAVREEPTIVLASTFEELRAFGTGEASVKMEKEEVVADHAGEEEGSHDVQGAALHQRGEGLLISGKDVKVGAARRACGVLGVTPTDLDAVPLQDPDPVSGEHSAVHDRDLLVQTVGKRKPLSDPCIAAEQAVPGIGGGTEQLGLVEGGEGLASLSGKQPRSGAGPGAAAVQARMPENKKVRISCSPQPVGHGLEGGTSDDVIAVEEQQVVTAGALRTRVAYPAHANDALQTHD